MDNKHIIGMTSIIECPITGNGQPNDTVSWHYQASDYFKLPFMKADVGDRALVAGEVIYVFDAIIGWRFDMPLTTIYQKCVGRKDGVPIHALTRLETKDDPINFEFSSEPRTNWTLGNWLAHFGARTNKSMLVELGSVMAVDMMIKQIIASIAEHDLARRETEPVTVKVTGGTQYQRFVVAMDIAGGLNNMEVKSGPGLAEAITLENNRGGLTYDKAVAVMTDIEQAGGIKVDIELSPVSGTND